MQKSYFSYVLRTWLTAIASCCTMSVCAQSEVTLETAGTLSSNLTECGKTLKISGPINGTDIKFLREKRPVDHAGSLRGAYRQRRRGV